MNNSMDDKRRAYDARTMLDNVPLSIQECLKYMKISDKIINIKYVECKDSAQSGCSDADCIS